MSLRTQNDKGPIVTASYVTSFLLVVCGETHLALPVGIIRGIVKPDDAGKAEALAELGVHTRITNLTERLGLVSTPSSEARILVCGRDPLRRAFLVTAIVGLEDIESAKITPLLPHFTGPEREWFSGTFLFREAVALVVEPNWLLEGVPDHIVEVGTSPVPHSDQETNAGGAGSGTVTLEIPVPVGQCDVLELEEATDADDIPWAQL